MSILSKDPSIYFAALPSSRTDETEILEWLETKGFKNMTNTRPMPYSTYELAHFRKGMTYFVGKHDDDPSTWFVIASDGEGNAVLVRTVEDHIIKEKILWACVICEDGCPAKEGSWKQARHLLEKMVR